MSLVRQNTGASLAVADGTAAPSGNQTALPRSTRGDGSSATRWVSLEVIRSSGSGNTTITGPVEVYVRNADDQWMLAQQLDEGLDVTVSDAVGKCWPLQLLSSYAEIYVKRGAISAGDVQFGLRSISEDSRVA